MNTVVKMYGRGRHKKCEEEKNEMKVKRGPGMMVMTMSREKKRGGGKEGPFFVHVVGTIRVGNEVRRSLFIFFFCV